MPRLQSELDEVQRPYAAVQAEAIKPYTADLRAAQRRLDELHVSQQAYQAEIAKLRFDLVRREEHQQSEAAQHRQQLEQLEGEVKRQQAEVSRLEVKLSGEQLDHASQQYLLQQQLDVAQQRHAVVQAEATERLEQYEADLQAAQRQRDEIEKVHNNSLIAGVAHHKQLVALQAELATVREQLAASQSAQRAAERESRSDAMHAGGDEASGGAAAAGASAAHTAAVVITPATVTVAHPTGVSPTAPTNSTAQLDAARDTRHHASHQHTSGADGGSPSAQSARKRRRASAAASLETSAATVSSSPTSDETSSSTSSSSSPTSALTATTADLLLVNAIVGLATTPTIRVQSFKVTTANWQFAMEYDRQPQHERRAQRPEGAAQSGG